MQALLLLVFSFAIRSEVKGRKRPFERTRVCGFRAVRNLLFYSSIAIDLVQLHPARTVKPTLDLDSNTCVEYIEERLEQDLCSYKCTIDWFTLNSVIRQ